MTIGRAATLGLLALALLVGTACPAGACSCAPPGPDGPAQQADVVFVGVVTGRTDGQAGQTIISTAGPVFHTFEVEAVEKGELGSQVEVVSALSEASCGFRFAEGARYRVYARHGPDGLTTGLCSGNERLRPARPRIPIAPMWPPWGWPLW